MRATRGAGCLGKGFFTRVRAAIGSVRRAMVHLALLLAAPVPPFYVGGKWLGPLLGIAALDVIARWSGARGGLSDLLPSPLPLWIVAAVLAWLLFEGPLPSGRASP
ncbi:MAG: hypothetical protein NZ704_08240 [Geminicoccaceae bacterium]|nr:hypothetical protein [Geminicoccaceae bacterium]